MIDASGHSIYPKNISIYRHIHILATKYAVYRDYYLQKQHMRHKLKRLLSTGNKWTAERPIFALVMNRKWSPLANRPWCGAGARELVLPWRRPGGWTGTARARSRSCRGCRSCLSARQLYCAARCPKPLPPATACAHPRPTDLTNKQDENESDPSCLLWKSGE